MPFSLPADLIGCFSIHVSHTLEGVFINYLFNKNFPLNLSVPTVPTPRPFPLVTLIVLGLAYIVHSTVCFCTCTLCTCGTGVNFLALSIRTYFISNRNMVANRKSVKNILFYGKYLIFTAYLGNKCFILRVLCCI